MLNSCADDNRLFGQAVKDTHWASDGNINDIMIGDAGND